MKNTKKQSLTRNEERREKLKESFKEKQRQKLKEERAKKDKAENDRLVELFGTHSRLRDAAELPFIEDNFPTIYQYNNFKFMWSIDVYREWFEYAKLSDNLPEQLQHIHNYDNFDDWWELRFNEIAQLFAEPLKDTAVTVVSNQNRHLVLDINLGYDYHRLRDKLLYLLKEHHKNSYSGSRAAFQPSKPPKDIKASKMDAPRKVYQLKQEGLSNLEIAREMEFITEEAYQYKLENIDKNNQNRTYHKNADLFESKFASAVRRINRDVKQCEEILSNIENGTFP